MKTLRMAWRQLLRDVAAGDIRILFAALVLAVVAVTAVGFVTDRAERALAIEANRLLGGDAVVRGDAPITGAVREAANAAGLRRTETLSLDSMIRAGEQLRLGDLRALGGGFPLRGSFRIIDAPGGAEHVAKSIPASGTLWMSQSGADTLEAKIGDEIGLGDARLRLAARVGVGLDQEIAEVDGLQHRVNSELTRPSAAAAPTPRPVHRRSRAARRPGPQCPPHGGTRLSAGLRA